MLWTIVGILLIIILAPLAARSFPAVGRLIRGSPGAVGNGLLALAALALVVLFGRRLLPGLARAMSHEVGVALLVLALVGVGIYVFIRARRTRRHRR